VAVAVEVGGGGIARLRALGWLERHGEVGQRQGAGGEGERGARGLFDAADDGADKVGGAGGEVGGVVDEERRARERGRVEPARRRGIEAAPRPAPPGGARAAAPPGGGFGLAVKVERHALGIGAEQSPAYGDASVGLVNGDDAPGEILHLAGRQIRRKGAGGGGGERKGEQGGGEGAGVHGGRGRQLNAWECRW
jgi:hypothetical protein